MTNPDTIAQIAATLYAAECAANPKIQRQPRQFIAQAIALVDEVKAFLRERETEDEDRGVRAKKPTYIYNPEYFFNVIK